MAKQEQNTPRPCRSAIIYIPDDPLVAPRGDAVHITGITGGIAYEVAMSRRTLTSIVNQGLAVLCAPVAPISKLRAKRKHRRAER